MKKKYKQKQIRFLRQKFYFISRQIFFASGETED